MREQVTPFENFSLKLKTSSGRNLIIADPHIGFEFSRGLRIRTGFELSLAEFIREEDPDLLIILGDVKEPIGLSLGMRKILLEFFSALRDTKIVITRGNHDGRIEEVTSRFENVRVVSYFKGDDYLFLHGHTSLPEVEFREAYLGHIHPAYIFKNTGAKRKVKVFARADRFLILPTINPYIKGFSVEEGIKMAPFLRCREWVDIFLPEGLYLGRIRLKNKE